MSDSDDGKAPDSSSDEPDAPVLYRSSSNDAHRVHVLAPEVSSGVAAARLSRTANAAVAAAAAPKTREPFLATVHVDVPVQVAACVLQLPVDCTWADLLQRVASELTGALHVERVAEALREADGAQRVEAEVDVLALYGVTLVRAPGCAPVALSSPVDVLQSRPAEPPKQVVPVSLDGDLPPLIVREDRSARRLHPESRVELSHLGVRSLGSHFFFAAPLGLAEVLRRAALPPPRRNPLVQSVRDVVPHVTDDVIITSLENMGRNVERVITDLLAKYSISEEVLLERVAQMREFLPQHSERQLLECLREAKGELEPAMAKAMTLEPEVSEAAFPEQAAQIKMILPDSSDEAIREALQATSGNVEAAIQRIFASAF